MYDITIVPEECHAGEEGLYQNPPIVYDATVNILDKLQDEIDELKAKDTELDGKITTANGKITGVSNSLAALRHSTIDFTNVVFIGDSYGTGWYEGGSEDPNNNWQVYLANILGITNYRRYAKGGLCFTKTSSNNLRAYIDSTVMPGETNPSAVTSIIIMIGVNDAILTNTNASITADSNETITYLQSKFPNAQIYCFYNSTSYLKYCSAIYGISEGLLKTKAIFIPESCQWMIGDSNMIENHPNHTASMQIAQNMAQLFKGQLKWGGRSSYTNFSAVDNTYSMTGGIFIQVNNMSVNIYTAGTRTDTQQRYAVTACKDGSISEFYRPVKNTQVPFFDMTNYVPGAMQIYSNGSVVQVVDHNTLSSVQTPNVYFSIPICYWASK